MKFSVIAALGTMLSGMSFGVTADEFKCQMILSEAPTGVILGSTSFDVSPIRKDALQLPPTTISSISVDLKTEKYEVKGNFDFTFQMGSGVEMATFSETIKLTHCVLSNGRCKNMMVGNNPRKVELVNGLPTFPGPRFAKSTIFDETHVSFTCDHIQTYP